MFDFVEDESQEVTCKRVGSCLAKKWHGVQASSFAHILVDTAAELLGPVDAT